MRSLLIIILVFTNLVAVAQNDTTGVKNSMALLDDGLLHAEERSKILNMVLNNDLSFGHSNGWIQTKQDVINDLESGKLVYKKIENSSVMFVSITKDRAIVRTNTNVLGILNGNDFQFKLHVLQVWIKTKKRGWQLLARQSIKL